MSSLTVLLDKYKNEKEKLQQAFLYTAVLAIVGFQASQVANDITKDPSFANLAASGVATLAATAGTYYFIEAIRRAFKTYEAKQELNHEASFYHKTADEVLQQYTPMDR